MHLSDVLDLKRDALADIFRTSYHSDAIAILPQGTVDRDSKVEFEGGCAAR
jgi:hypothetical protein